MAVEIERKFLVHKDKWNALKKPSREFYRQGYIVNEPGKTIRVRQTDFKGFITIKGATTGISRQEFEYEIPRSEAGELLGTFTKSSLTKYRYKIEFKGKIWEIDEFQEDNEGLIVAEIELESENEKFELPDWVDKEVTGEEKYYNSFLSVRPYKTW
ncbi:MAG: CYTH domain-containing protein [Bacteroidia bacterium]|jgi:CYTH domain-containing protein